MNIYVKSLKFTRDINLFHFINYIIEKLIQWLKLKFLQIKKQFLLYKYSQIINTDFTHNNMEFEFPYYI